MDEERIDDATGNGSESKLDSINAKWGDRVIVQPSDFERGTESGSFDGGNHRARSDTGKRNKDGSVPKKRGRKPGQSYAGAQKKASDRIDVSGIEKILLSAHMMAAAAFAVPELALDKTESEELSKAIANVAQYYDTTVAPETLAWINLGAVAVSIYGTRAFVLLSKRGEKKPIKPEPIKTVNAAPPPKGVDASVFAHANAAG